MDLANMAAHVVPARSESVYERGGGRHGQRASGRGAGHRLRHAVSEKQVKGGRTQVIWAHLRLPAATQVQTGLPRLVRWWGREGRDTPPPATRLEAAL